MTDLFGVKLELIVQLLLWVIILTGMAIWFAGQP